MTYDTALREALALRAVMEESLHVALPGKVTEYDPETRRATIQPMLKDRKHGGRSLPALREVPVFCPVNRDGENAFAIRAGDGCLVVFADGGIDEWLATGQESIPGSGRKHDLADGFAFVGFTCASAL